MPLTRKRLDGPGLSGLLATRRGALVLALVCALAATGILMFALSKYRHAAAGGAKQDTVLVATAKIEKGTTGDAIASKGLYKVTPILATQVAPGAIENAGALSGEHAASNILPGQQLTSADFVSGGTGIPAQLTPNQRAISLTLDASHGLDGVLEAGDYVDVYGGFNLNAVPVIRLLADDATVLKVGTGGGTTGAGGGQVLLAVTNTQAATLAYTADYGRVWLVLRPASAVNPRQYLTDLPTIVRSVVALASGDHANTNSAATTPTTRSKR